MIPLRRSAGVLALGLLLFPASAAFAAWQPTGSSIGGSNSFALADGAGNLISGGAVKRSPNDVLLWSVGVPLFTMSAAPDRSGGAIYAGAQASSQAAARISAAGAVAWGPVAVCNATRSGVADNLTTCATDAAGNVYVAWKDQRVTLNNWQLYVQKLSPAGVPQWTTNGVLVYSLTLSNTSPPPLVIPDEAGGCYIAWQDIRLGISNSDIYAQHVDGSGNVLWAANGVGVCTAAGIQNNLLVASDGAGGALLLWLDQRSGDVDIYAQRLDGAGNALWTPNGRGIVVVASSDQGEPAWMGDGAGGAFLTWSDCRNCGTSGTDIYAEHVDGTGASTWIANGVLVAGTPVQEATPSLTTDGNGGIIVSWGANTSPGAPFAQRLDATGAAQWQAGGVQQLLTGNATPLVSDGAGGAYLGAAGRIMANGEPAWPENFRPAIGSVSDVPADEGGWVSVGFGKPLSDGGSIAPQTTGYSLWRKVPGSAASGQARLLDAAKVLGSSPSSRLAKYDFPPGTWQSVSYLPAMHATSYSLLGPTHSDATQAGLNDEDFVVVGHTAGVPISGGVTLLLYVVSSTGTGHSVDNLAPGAPQAVTGGYAGGTTVQLRWANNPEADLWHYSVYRGTSADFTPSASNRIGQPTSASFQDDAYDPGNSYYKISAIDRHDNESGFSLLSPSQITSVPPGTTPSRAYLAAPAPNPFDSRTSFEYGLAREGPVRLEIYDLRGRRIARLVDEVESAGVRKAAWDGLDESHHRAPAGIYLLRFSTSGFSQRRKLIRTS